VVGDRTDADVIAASLEHGEEFSLIYERYHTDIFRYIARRLGSDVAGDVASDVFTAAFRRRHTYKLEVPMCRPWLYGIASNLVRDALRRQKRKQRAYLHAATIEAASDVSMADAEARANAAQMVPEISDALRRLNQGDREVLLLYSLGEMSYEEVATALGIPIGTVRSRLARARRKMQELLPADRQTMVGE
jgi:RNA polymerase sigma-70 factor (ECF subfamily)